MTRKPTEEERSTDDAFEVVDEAAESSSSASENVDFPCKNCGAEMRWDPVADVLACGYCQHTVDVPRKEGTILERPLSDAGAAARGLGLDRRVVRCDTCGASVSLDESATADVCVYCGSSAVLDQEANRNAIRPESLIPLDVGREYVEAAFKRWIKGLWFRPNELKKARRFNAMGIYIPFWSYDCRVHSDWSADAGHYYYVTETYWTTVNGKQQMRTRQVRKVRWVPAWGARDDVFDDVLINASLGVPGDLIHKLGSFDTRKLVPYQPQYLAGWRSEEYQVDLATGWKQMQGIVESRQRSRCSSDVPGDTQRFLRVHNTITDPRWKHILLPIWVLQYRFGQSTYSVLIHGQTGKIVGKAPYSWVKITLFVLAILAAIGVVALVMSIAGVSG